MTRDIILGGTFGLLHDGHREMLRTAFQAGRPTIGVTSDELARRTRDDPRYIPLVSKRKVILHHECEKLAEEYDREYDLFVLQHPTEPAVTGDHFDAIVISPEDKTRERVQDINEKRTNNGLDELEMIEADMVQAEDGDRISSTRIIRGEIDAHGNIINWF